MIPSNLIVVAIDVAIWAVCIGLGMLAGSILGRIVGVLLGWMVANSLDESLLAGGRLGQQIGKVVGVGLWRTVCDDVRRTIFAALSDRQILPFYVG